MAEIWAAGLATAAVGIYGANQAKGAAKDALGAQTAASEATIAEQRRQFDINQANQTPWLQHGQKSLGQLDALNAGDYSGFMNSPDYLAAQQASGQQLDRSAAARGGFMGGGADADRIALGQQLATQYLGNYRGALQSGAGLGQSSANQLGAYGANYAGNVGNAYGNIGNARASSYGAIADSNTQLAAGLGGLFNNWYQGNLANNPGGTGWYVGKQPGRG